MIKLTTIVTIHYKVQHHIRYVLANNSVVGLYLKNSGLLSNSQPSKFYVRCTANN